MPPKESVWYKIAQYARYSPSPHNTQPSRLKIISDNHAQVIFIPSRGLYVADPSGRFTYAAFGAFIEISKIAAASLGFNLSYKYQLQPLYPGGDHKTPQVIADLFLEKKDVKDIDASLILKRHTSRLPYNNLVVDSKIINELQIEAEKWGHNLTVRHDKEAIKWIVELNQSSLFNDLEDTGTREELKKWLRYSKKDAISKKDGLSSTAMIMPGWVMKGFFYHHKFWTMPGVKQFAFWVYGRTMRGIANIAWIQGPFVTVEDMLKSGQVLVRLWLIMTKHNVRLHPYGSIITNDKSRNEMIKKLGIGDEQDGKNMVWLLMRLGYSQEPPHSERLPLEDYFI